MTELHLHLDGYVAADHLRAGVAPGHRCLPRMQRLCARISRYRRMPVADGLFKRFDLPLAVPDAGRAGARRIRTVGGPLAARRRPGGTVLRRSFQQAMARRRSPCARLSPGRAARWKRIPLFAAG
ncbi:MAG: hypothetical protein ACLSDO_03525 [Anaerotruncus colihominis]